MGQALDVPALSGRTTVILTVRDVAASSGFYVRVLGLEEVRRWEDAGGRLRDVTLRAGGSGLELGLVEHDGATGALFDERRPGLDHLEFLVEHRSDLDEWARHLDARGIAHSGVKAPAYTRNAMLTFRDPDGIQLEFFWTAPPP